jgi:hypothetical protein
MDLQCDVPTSCLEIVRAQTSRTDSGPNLRPLDRDPCSNEATLLAPQTLASFLRIGALPDVLGDVQRQHRAFDVLLSKGFSERFLETAPHMR